MPVAAVVGVFILVGVTVVVAASTVWWFRRQDRLTRAQVEAALKKEPAGFPGIEADAG